MGSKMSTVVLIYKYVCADKRGDLQTYHCLFFFACIWTIFSSFYLTCFHFPNSSQLNYIPFFSTIQTLCFCCYCVSWILLMNCVHSLMFIFFMNTIYEFLNFIRETKLTYGSPALSWITEEKGIGIGAG